MYKLLVRSKIELIEFFLQEILHSFHIMVGDRFNIFDALGICHCKVLVNTPQPVVNFSVNFFQLRKWKINQGNKIFYFYKNAVPD